MAVAARPMTGKTALVTGAGKRLGRAIALALAGEGVGVYLHYHRSAGEAEQVAAEVRAKGVRAWTAAADLADPDGARRLMVGALEAAGSIEILVNNASIFPAGRILDTTPEDIARNVNVHAVAPLVLVQAMAAQGIEGHVVNLLDSRITDYDRAHAAYHASKRLLFSLTRMMSLEFSPGIRVNAVAPGLVLPPAGKDESYLEALAHTNPLHRYGSLEDVVRAVVFLIESEFITGQIIYVDGGRHMRGSVYGA